MVFHHQALPALPPPRVVPFALLFEQREAERQARLFDALSSPMRVQILGLLVRYGGLISVEEMAALLPLTQPTISHHLRNLREARLIECQRQGLRAYYQVAPAALHAAQQALSALFPAEGKEERRGIGRTRQDGGGEQL